MLDLGWSEIFVIVVLAILLVGPKELPTVMRSIGHIFRRLHYIKYTFSKQFEDFMRESDLDELRKSVNFEVRARESDNFNEAEADEEYLKAEEIKTFEVKVEEKEEVKDV